APHDRCRSHRSSAHFGKLNPLWSPSHARTAPLVRNLHDVPVQELQWLWPGYLPRGKLTLLDGDPGLGKSVLSLDLAARVSSGRPYPHGPGAFAAGRVLLFSCEDNVGDTIKPRLQHLQADLKKVDIFDGSCYEGQETGQPPLFPRDLPVLRNAMER